MYFLNIALSVATRSTCLRRKLGAVIVNGNTIVGTGYNGNAKGVINCYEVGCIKDEKSLPLAGIDADGEYTKAVPCQRCQRKIINSEIEEVVLLDESGNPVRIDVKDFVQGDTAWYIKELAKIRNPND